MPEEIKQIETPLSLKHAGPEDDIIVHVMPKEFFGRGVQAQMQREVQKTVAPPVVPTKPKIPVQIAPQKPKPPSRTPLVVAGIAIVIVAVLIAAVVYLVPQAQHEDEIALVEKAISSAENAINEARDSMLTTDLDIEFNEATNLIDSAGAKIQDARALLEDDEYTAAGESAKEAEDIAEDAKALINGLISIAEEAEALANMEPQSGEDTDSDGLTDVEERIYGTDYRNPDSDGDNYLDGNEVFHRYDPLAFSPATLIETDSVLIKEVLDADGVGYSIYYPSSWDESAVDSESEYASGSLFVARDGAEIQINIYDLGEDEDFDSWYSKNIAGTDGAEDLKEVSSKEGYSGFMTHDELTTYLIVDGRVFELRYDLKDAKTVEYLQTFEMMVNSFMLLP